MTESIRVLGVITARGGSRGIPRKNLADVAGKPLIAFTIDAARASRLLTRCIVSTDDEDIADTARNMGADVPFMRPAELASDTAGSVDVVRHALQWLRENGRQEFDYVMILQPTSPFRTGEDIDACIRIAADTGADSVMSMAEVPDFAPQKLKLLDGDRIRPYLQDEGKQSAHRSETPVYKRNTAIYLTKTSCIEVGDLFGADSRAYVMPRERSIDINDDVDLAFARFLASRRS